MKGIGEELVMGEFLEVNVRARDIFLRLRQDDLVV